MAKKDIERLISHVEGYEEYYNILKNKKEEWNTRIEILREKIDEIVGPRVLVFPIEFENIFEIDVEDVKIKEFRDIDDFEGWIVKKAKNGKYLLVHSIYREFLLYIKESDKVIVYNLRDLPKPDKIIESQT